MNNKANKATTKREANIAVVIPTTVLCDVSIW